MRLDEAPQSIQIAFRCCIAVDADRPHPAPVFFRSPKLLWNPSHLTTQKRNARQPIRDVLNSSPFQNTQRRVVGSMSRRHPDSRTQTFIAQRCDPLCNPCTLRLFIDAGKFRPATRPVQAPSVTSARMLPSVQPDRRSASLQCPHSHPEAGVRIRNHEFWVAIVRNHRQDRSNSESLDETSKPLPSRKRKRWAQIVKP